MGLDEASETEGGWQREVVLDLTAPDGVEDPLAIWSFNDTIEKVTVPTPTLQGEVICIEYGAGRALYALVLLLKADWLQEWQEAWFFMIRPPEGRDKAVVKWQEYVPRMPLPIGRVAGIGALQFLGRDRAVAALNVSGSWGNPPFLLANLGDETLMFYPSASALLLEGKDEQKTEDKALDQLESSKDDWFQCSSLSDCAVTRNHCSQPTGVRRDSEKMFREWSESRQFGEGCDSLPENGCKPRLGCNGGKCVVEWSPGGPEVECGF